MGFVASTDQNQHKILEIGMTEDLHYCLAPGVRVRKERFGLLFYDSRSTKLTFVKSGNLFDLGPESHNTRLILSDEGCAGKTKVQGVLDVLVKKGLIRDTPAVL
jgi:putative mycofactocin binding protein MftB